MPDFKLSKYRELLTAIINNNKSIFNISDWFKLKPNEGVVIRHDVDRFKEFVLPMARLEKELGVKTTYFFRIVKSVFSEEIVSEVSNLGHEIGYHYEDLSLANGNFEKAKELFSFHLSRLREIAEVKTCAMHGRPFSKYDNRDLWKKLFAFSKIKIDALQLIEKL